jgi:hypothetical protein
LQTHSFPTRRSSDLLVRLAVDVNDGVLVIVGLEELVEVRVGVRLWEGVGLIEAEAVDVNVDG